LVSAQIIIVSIAILGFFATGGLSKVSGAVGTAKKDFAGLRGKVTDFQQSIVDQPKTNTEQLTKQQAQQIVKAQPDFIPNRDRIALPIFDRDRTGVTHGDSPRPDLIRTHECRAGECGRPRGISPIELGIAGTGGKQTRDPKDRPTRPPIFDTFGHTGIVLPPRPTPNTFGFTGQAPIKDTFLAGTGGKQFDRTRKPQNTDIGRAQSIIDLKKRGGFGF